jgi:NAD(P)-dependent dehydrogenase (short-subunit alcohol dehydrogenase family)
MIAIDLSGTVAVVTGASGGIGAGIAARFVEAGAYVVQGFHSQRPVDLGANAIAVEGDLRNGVEPLLDAAQQRWGRVDHWVNNAGIQPVGLLADLDDDALRAMSDMNFVATMRATRDSAAAMVDGGSIVQITSIEGLSPAPGHSHYSGTKAALHAFSQAAANELGPKVRVNCVAPGLIDRPGLIDDWPQGVQRWTSHAPMERLGTPLDVANAVVFLCSPLASWITGSVVVVDGGVLAHPTW